MTCRCASLFALLLGVSTPTGAIAHHGNATNRLGPDPAGGRLVWEAAPAPRAFVTAGYERTEFSRARQGSDRYERAELGRVSVDALTLQAGVEFETRTQLTLRLPMGWTTVRPADGATRSAIGLGDLALGAAQPWALADAVRLRFEGGLVLPTGRYAEEPALSLTDIAGVSGGGVDVVTYDTRASLGAGAWSPYADASLGARWGRATTVVGLGLQAPLTRTTDGIRWGYDLQARLGGLVSLWRSRRGYGVTLGGGVDYRRHGRDDVPDPETGATAPAGGRHDVGARARAHVSLPDGAWCAAQARLPIWQYAGGIQLMETFSAGATCAISVGL